MNEVGIPMKLIGLTKMYIDNAQHKVKVENTMSEAIEVKTRLQQDDILSPMLFYLALEKAIKELQKESTGISIGERKI